MRKPAVFITMLVLAAVLALAGYTKQCQSKGEQAGAQARAGNEYRGGPGGGSASCEYVGPLDNSKLDNRKIEPQKAEGGLGDLLRRWFKRRN